MTHENLDHLTTCLVLSGNLNKFMAEIDRRPELERELIPSWESNVRRLAKEELPFNFEPLNIYPEFSKKLKTEFSISNDQAFELVNILERLAIGYLSYFQTKTLRPIIKQFHVECLDINERLGVLADEIEEKMEVYETLLSVLSCEKLNGGEYTDALKSVINARNKLKLLPDSIGHSALAKGSEFNKAARPTNWALLLWIEALYAYWINILGRTISNNNDGINGRKHLLEFLLFCIEPLHEAVEFETLDNTLRRVQRDIEKRGGLRSPDFKIGSSSPFGVL